MSRRIILFGPLPPPFGGVSVYLEALSKRLRQANVRVWAYTGAREQRNDVRFVSHRRLETFWSLIAEGRRARILDATHFHFEYPNALLLSIWLLLKPILRFAWIKNVLDGSLPERHKTFTRLQRFLFARALKSIDEFIVVSEELKLWLQREQQVRQPITVIPCLLPPGDEDNHDLDPALSSSLAGYLKGSKRVCSIGVFIPEYGFADVADAAAALREDSGQEIQLLLLDGNFACDERYREKVLRGRPWITVIEEAAHETIPQLLKLSDVFVRATKEEGFGISRIEAIWSGTPVIATKAGETRGMLTYDFGNREELINHLTAVLLGSTAVDTSVWAERYREEAENNLNELRKMLLS
jgi:glycosyltransferase involved in cell wall biosynthesis